MYVGHLQAIFVYFYVASGSSFVCYPSFLSDPTGAAVGPTNYSSAAIQAGGAPHSLVLPVLGPYFRLDVNNVTGVNGSVQVMVLGVLNAASSVPIFPAQVQIDNPSLSIAPNKAFNVQPIFSTPGRYRGMVTISQNGYVDAQRWSGSSWDTFWQAATANGTLINLDLIMPIDDWRFSIGNLGASTATGFIGLVGPE